MLYHVVAMAENRIIGKNNRLPWHFSSDSKHFKRLTTGHTILMGRKTFESLGKKPLPNRENFVLSRSRFEAPNSIKMFDSVENALKNATSEKVFIIGGASLYEQTMPLVDGIYMTKISARYDGDTFYPEIPSYFKGKSREKLQDNPTIEVIFYENTKKG